MNAERLREINEKGGLVLLAGRTRFRLTGTDRVRYLNGQVTQDVKLANDGEALYACVTDIKGRVVGDGFVHASSADSALYWDSEPALREILGPRFERYIISEDVELSDVTDDWELWHFFKPQSDGLEGKGVLSSRMGCPGVDVWIPSGGAKPDFDAPVLSEAEQECLRILRGIPRYPNELGGGIFPPEAGLEASAMSYTKGCYIGQEVLSRIRSSGKMPRRLVRCESEVGEEHRFSAGDFLFQLDGEGVAKKMGEVTSVAFDPASERWVGMAYVKSSCLPADSGLLVGGCEPRIDGQVKISSLVNK